MNFAQQKRAKLYVTSCAHRVSPLTHPVTVLLLCYLSHTVLRALVWLFS